MVEFAGQNIPLPDVSMSGVGSFFIWFVSILLVSALLGFFVYLWIMNKRFKYRITVFEKVGNSFEPTRRDKAMEFKLGRTGDSIFYLRKHKKYLPYPEIQVGRKNYWYFIRQDGEWINIGLEDLDQAMRTVKANFLHKEMRYARTGLQKYFRERYVKPSFLEKYGSMILALGTLTVIFVFMFLIGRQLVSSLSLAGTVAEQTAINIDKVTELLSKMDNVCANSGIRPATWVLSLIS